MSIQIKRIYLENYKLFPTKEICFADKLSVFGGPNGYGKTSIFDALELLITGSIDRIQNSESINGKLAYSHNCLAGNPAKDVKIKAELQDTENGKTTVLAMHIPGSARTGKDNNPSKIEKQASFYVLPTYDTPAANWKDSLSFDKAAAYRAQLFGSQSISSFRMLHYIRQEDRLAYFKRSEGERLKTITDMFGIEKAVEKRDSLDKALAQLKKKYIEEEGIWKKEQEMIEAASGIERKGIPYKPLLGGRAPWDREELGFKGSDSEKNYEGLKKELRDIAFYLKNKDWYLIDSAISRYEETEPAVRAAALRGWALTRGTKNVFSIIQDKQKKLDFLSMQKSNIAEGNYPGVEWGKLCTALDCANQAETIREHVEALQSAGQNRTELDRLASALYQARDTLAQRNKEAPLPKDGTCPYCGWKWESDQTLQEQFQRTKDLMKRALGSGNALYAQAVQRCKDFCEKNITLRLEAKIEKLEEDPGLQLLRSFSGFEQFRVSVENCIPLMNYIRQSGAILAEEIKPQTIDAYIERLRAEIPPHYVQHAAEHDLGRIEKLYSSDQSFINLTEQQLKDKEAYLGEQYSASFDTSRQRLQTLKENVDKLKDLCDAVEQYRNNMRDAIYKYQEDMIRQIEIPFFLYSSRLLQSYQSELNTKKTTQQPFCFAQGVMIKISENQIRFTALGGEHDILYTMSSGQLSAVLLALSLVLNKRYCADQFKTLFIDDPIQCMDDINMISFVELLGREFSDTQVLLSTHEDSFANYIQYKYSKFGLASKLINLKEESISENETT